MCNPDLLIDYYYQNNNIFSLLILQEGDIKVNKDKEQKEDIQRKVNPLNIFYTIHLMRKMLILPVQKLFVDKVSGKPIFRFKYTSMMCKEMQKMGIPALLIKSCCYRETSSIENGITKNK
jgi:hypothetical protein